jgi:hypothetical protein
MLRIARIGTNRPSFLGMSEFAKWATAHELEGMTFQLFRKPGKNLGVIGIEVYRQDVTTRFVLLNPYTANPRLV